MTVTITPGATGFEMVTDQLVAYSYDLNNVDPDASDYDCWFTALEANHFLEELTRGARWDFDCARREVTVHLSSGVALAFAREVDADSAETAWAVTATLGWWCREFTGRTAFNLADRLAGLVRCPTGVRPEVDWDSLVSLDAGWDFGVEEDPS